MQETPTDGRIRRGDRTRREVVRAAVDIASVDGLDGLSIGRLAAELGISKSGLIGHFGSKEELQLATIRAARAIFVHTIIEPALQMPPGTSQVRALLDGWLEYSCDRRFPGGCFFARASHEYAARPGPVHDAQTAVDEEWRGLLEESVRGAPAAGEIDPGVDAAQLAFELDAYLDSANLRSLLGRPSAYDRAARSVAERLASVGTGASARSPQH